MQINSEIYSKYYECNNYFILFLILSKILFNTGTNDIRGKMIVTKEYGYMKNNNFQKLNVSQIRIMHVVI